MSDDRRPWGLLAEFTTAGAMVDAVRSLRAQGYRALDAHSPFPVEGLAEVLGLEDERVDIAHVIGGMVVAALAVGMIVWGNAVSYPLNIGGRPLIAWPAFVLPTFEIATVGATLAGVGAMLWLNRLPDRGHPLLRMDSFHLASDAAFFVSVQADDPQFDMAATRAVLEGLGAVRVEEVPQ